MTDDPLMVGPDRSTTALARFLSQKRIHRVIVADDENSTLGIITTSMDLPGAFPQAQRPHPDRTASLDIRCTRKDLAMSSMTTAVPAKSVSKKTAAFLNQSTLPREPASGGVTTERIRERAYQIYTERRAKGESADSLSDWLHAERELTSSTSGRSAASEIETKALSRGEKLLASGK